jgi:hypothetical protein
MARLLPNENPSNISLDPERAVAEALCEQFPPDVVVFHSYPWLRRERDLDKPNNRDVLREGEADFVVVHPRYGIAVVEVKGGHMLFDPATQRWDRHGATHAVKDPFTQASKNIRALEKQLVERSFGGDRQLPFSRVRCVVFPDCDFEGTLPQGAERSMLFGASDLATLGQKLDKLFRLQTFVPHNRLDKAVLDGITKALTSTFRLVPVLWREIEAQERRIFRFTEDQIRLLHFIESHPRATIEGVAGSGKTMLAIARARRFADEGKDMKVLFLCFNSMLADWLKAELPEEYHNRISIKHYHKLCSDWCIGAGLSWPQAESGEFWAGEAPSLLEKAIDLRPDERFDAVVVDEGQDFLTGWWDTVELINRKPMEGPLYIFTDPAQQLFQANNPARPDLGKPFVLPCNCRNTSAIAEACGKIIQKQIPVKKDAPKGRPPKILIARTPEAQRTEVENQVKEWLRPDGLKPHQRIAVVTRTSVENSSCAGMVQVGGRRLSSDLAQWREGKCVLITSLGKFKGLEADALVLVDAIKPDPDAGPQGFRPAHYYVACSRAKHLLTVLMRE